MPAAIQFLMEKKEKEITIHRIRQLYNPGVPCTS